MDGGVPSRDRFQAVIGAVLERCAVEYPGGAAYVHGEMVDLLWRDGKTAAAAQLEVLWNELAERHHFHLLCTYPMAGFSDASHAPAFEEICGHHTRVFPTERYTQSEDQARLRDVASLQQRARALETELGARRRLEGELRGALAERTRAQEEVRQREQELKDCLENAVEAIHWVAGDGTILWANRSELEMLGYAPEEYLGHHIAEFHVDGPVIQQILCRLTDGETLRDEEARLRHKDGSVRHVLINSNVLWRDGLFVHTRCFTRDVTEAKRAAAERELLLVREQRARHEAEAASRAKSEFLAVMSHELRTPLNAIGGYVDLLELGVRGPLTETQREDLGRIQKSQRHLLGLINEVLNYTRVEAGAVRYELADVRLGEVVASVEPLIRPQLDARGLALLIEPLGDATVRADREKVRQVLLNLLSNAVKFTDRGGRVTIRCEAAAPTQPGAMVELQVVDTGEGIPANKLEAVFEPFVQAHTGLTRPHDGVGLGLAISRDLARGMGGELTARSTMGQGSTFTLSLPAA
jgi:PAS domain S-box-containing protein